MIKSLRIWWLRRQAKHAYFAHQAALDQLSCGQHLGEYMLPSALHAKLRFNKCLDALAKLDPNTPTARL